MSIANVQSFLEQVTQNQSLQEELATAMEAENDRQAVTALGQSKGYDFTADELWQEIQKRQTEIQSNKDAGELSESDLETIAGGGVVEDAVLNVTKGYNNTVDSLKKVKW
jgi:predicted ribosomally synthesized peptide with nif11-like leader